MKQNNTYQSSLVIVWSNTDPGFGLSKLFFPWKTNNMLVEVLEENHLKYDIIYKVLKISVAGLKYDIIYKVLKISVAGLKYDIIYKVLKISVAGLKYDIIYKVLKISVAGLKYDIIYKVLKISVAGLKYDIIYKVLKISVTRPPEAIAYSNIESIKLFQRSKEEVLSDKRKEEEQCFR